MSTKNRRPRTIRRWTGDSVDQLVACWADGASIADIAARLGRTVPQVKSKVQAMRSAGDEARVPFRRAPPHQATDDQITELWNAAVATTQIAATIGLSEPGVRKRVERLRARGMPVVSGNVRRGHHISIRREELARWLTEHAGSGAGLSAATNELGVSVAQLSDDVNALLDAGVITRNAIAAIFPTRTSRDRRDAILGLARAGKQRSEIARELGLSASYVKDNLKYLRRRGALPAAPVPPPAHIDDARLTSLWNRGMTASAIAAQMQIEERIISNRVQTLRAAGHPLARRRTQWARPVCQEQERGTPDPVEHDRHEPARGSGDSYNPSHHAEIALSARRAEQALTRRMLV